MNELHKPIKKFRIRKFRTLGNMKLEVNEILNELEKNIK